MTNSKKAPLVVVQPEGSLGVDGDATQVSLQTDIFKELINKLSWAIGSTYRRPYNNRRMRVRELAVKVATRLVSQEGWPSHIQKERAP